MKKKTYEKWNLKELKNVDLETRFAGLLDYIDNTHNIQEDENIYLFLEELECIKTTNRLYRGHDDLVIKKAIALYREKYSEKLIFKCI
jgi:hypothetical protein